MLTERIIELVLSMVLWYRSIFGLDVSTIDTIQAIKAARIPSIQLFDYPDKVLFLFQHRGQYQKADRQQVLVLLGCCKL
jgi:hypothetical protein